MMVALRADNEYPICLAVTHDDGSPPTRVDTGLVAAWVRNELVVMVATNDLEGVIATLRAAVGMATREAH